MSLTHLVIHLEVQQVYGAPLAVEHVLGLGDDGGDEALQAHLLLEEAPRQSQQELEGGKELGDVFITKEAPSIITEKVAALLPTLNNEASYSVMGRERERVGEKVVSFVSGLLNFKWKVLREGGRWRRERGRTRQGWSGGKRWFAREGNLSLSFFYLLLLLPYSSHMPVGCGGPLSPYFLLFFFLCEGRKKISLGTEREAPE